jgi:hypothetical protein
MSRLSHLTRHHTICPGNSAHTYTQRSSVEQADSKKACATTGPWDVNSGIFNFIGQRTPEQTTRRPETLTLDLLGRPKHVVSFR